jgi:hypothetical protein
MMRSISGAGKGHTANLHPESRDDPTMNMSESKHERRKGGDTDDSWSTLYAVRDCGRVA